jgi:hypothetical protein
LEVVHCFGARLALFFNLFLNPVEQRIELTVQLKQRMIRGD